MTPKCTLRVLIWLEQLPPQGGDWVRDIDILRRHLHDDLEDVCNIQLLVSHTNARLISQSQIWDLQVTPVKLPSVNEETWPEIDDFSLRQAIATARSEDCDYIVVPDELLPYLQAVEQHFHIGLVDLSFLLKCIEIFVRGFGVAWSFAGPVFNGTFETLYLCSELRETFDVGLTLMGRLETTKQEPAAIDTGRTLIFNRIPHLCFSRDKLLFYLFQRDAALREDATWHPFALELAYHLNFHYLLLYGAFDHAALFVNGVLGLPEKKVGAKDEAFRKKLKSVSPSLHAIFADTATTEFLNQLGALRNYTAHRGSINPSELVQKREKEPTDEEIDAYLHESGHDAWLLDFPEGPQRTNFRVILRSTARSDLLGKNPIDHDVVLVEIDKKWCLVHPLTDVTRNLRRTLCFLRRVFDECIKILT